MSRGLEDNYLALTISILSPVEITPEEAFWVLDGKLKFGCKAPFKRGRPKSSKEENSNLKGGVFVAS